MNMSQVISKVKFMSGYIQSVFIQTTEDLQRELDDITFLESCLSSISIHRRSHKKINLLTLESSRLASSSYKATDGQRGEDNYTYEKTRKTNDKQKNSPAPIKRNLTDNNSHGDLRKNRSSITHTGQFTKLASVPVICPVVQERESVVDHRNRVNIQHHRNDGGNSSLLSSNPPIKLFHKTKKITNKAGFNSLSGGYELGKDIDKQKTPLKIESTPNGKTHHGESSTDVRKLFESRQGKDQDLENMKKIVRSSLENYERKSTENKLVPECIKKAAIHFSKSNHDQIHLSNDKRRTTIEKESNEREKRARDEKGFSPFGSKINETGADEGERVRISVKTSDLLKKVEKIKSLCLSKKKESRDSSQQISSTIAQTTKHKQSLSASQTVLQTTSTPTHLNRPQRNNLKKLLETFK